MPKPAATANNPCPQCGKLKYYSSRLCWDCHQEKRKAGSVAVLRQQRQKAREGAVNTCAEEMVELVKATPKPKPSPPVTYEPMAASEMLVNTETGQPVKVKVGPSTVQFVQCPKRAEGEAHHYLLDQANHGACSCGAERDWPMPDHAIGWGDDGAMTWE